VTAKSLSTTRFHRRGDKTPPCGHHPATLAVKLLPISELIIAFAIKISIVSDTALKI
jgi:hypothetical protein